MTSVAPSARDAATTAARAADPPAQSLRAARAACRARSSARAWSPGALDGREKSCTRATTQSSPRVTLAVAADLAHGAAVGVDLGDVAARVARPELIAQCRELRAQVARDRLSAVSRQRTYRCAVFSPTPGSATGARRGARALVASAALDHPGNLHAAGDLLELGLHRLVGLLDRRLTAAHAPSRASRSPRSSRAPGRCRCARPAGRTSTVPLPCRRGARRDLAVLQLGSSSARSCAACAPPGASARSSRRGIAWRGLLAQLLTVGSFTVAHLRAKRRHRPATSGCLSTAARAPRPSAVRRASESIAATSSSHNPQDALRVCTWTAVRAPKWARTAS